MMKFIKLFIFTISVLILLVSCSYGNVVMHAHSYGSWQTDIQPTCTEEGTLTRTCACGYVERTTVKPLSHSYSDKKIISEPTCKTQGLTEYTCKLCGDVKYDISDKTAHIPSEKYIVTDSYHARKCATCDATVGKEEHFYLNGTCVICYHSMIPDQNNPD